MIADCRAGRFLAQRKQRLQLLQRRGGVRVVLSGNDGPAHPVQKSRILRNAQVVRADVAQIRAVVAVQRLADGFVDELLHGGRRCQIIAGDCIDAVENQIGHDLPRSVNPSSRYCRQKISSLVR